jgi:hypothetical protein
MDARTILCPMTPVEIDWDTVMEPPANKGAPTRPESELEPEAPGVAAKLSADDIEAVSLSGGRVSGGSACQLRTPHLSPTHSLPLQAG